MRSSKRTLTRFLLEKIGEVGIAYFDTFFPRKYSYARISRDFFGIDDYPRAMPATISSLLSRLKKQGLIASRLDGGKKGWALTSRGKARIQTSKNIPVPQSDGITRLVIFDIPERERKKRDTIRTELIALNFTRLQKSVWMGKTPLPEDFIALVDDLRLKGKLHIFSIRESGTISEMNEA